MDVREQRAWRSYVHAHARLLAELNRRLLAGVELSIADYEVLVHLSEARDASLRIYELAEVLQWERSRLSHHVSRMERRGLVTREGCETDARGAFVVLSADGRHALEEAAPLHAADVRELFVKPAGKALAEVDAASRRIASAIDLRGIGNT